jgi:hypothetical protein
MYTAWKAATWLANNDFPLTLTNSVP